MFYAMHNSYGLNFKFHCPEYSVLAFETEAERDKYVEENRYHRWTGTLVTAKCSHKEMMKIMRPGPDARCIIDDEHYLFFIEY